MKANRLTWALLLLWLGNPCSQRLVSADTTNNPTPTVFSASTVIAKEETIDALRAKAEKGDAQAQFDLGRCYHHGQGVATNYAEAAKWYRQAAEQKNVKAQTGLGYCYAMGLGVARDGVEAVKWYRLAAEQGFAKAQTSLGYCYATGLGVTLDGVEAVKWYRQAAEQNYAEAQLNLSLCYDDGLGVPKDGVEAYKWSFLAAAQGDERARKRTTNLESKMSQEQIIEGKRRASDWLGQRKKEPAGQR